MSLDKSYKRIDKIMSALQGVSAEDLSPLEGLLRVYFLLFKSLKKADSGDLAHIAHECRHVLQLLLEGKTSDPADWLKRLVDSTSQLQLAIYEELEIEEATFSIFELPDIHPPKGLSQTAPAPSDAPAAPEPSPVAPPSVEAAPLPPPVEDNPMAEDPELVAEFIAEVEEYLEEAETLLLVLEHEPEDEEALNGIFRAFHTLKGVAGFMGQELIQNLAHETENLLDMAREKEVVLEGTKFEVTLEARDVIHGLVDDLNRLVRGEPTEGASVPPDLIPRLKAETGGASGPDLASLDAQFGTPEAPTAATPEELIPLAPEEPLPPVEAVSPPPPRPQEAPPAAAPAATSTPLILTAANLEAVGDNDMLVDFVEDSTEHLDSAEGHLLTLEKDPENNEALAAVFRGFHTIKGVAGFLALDAVQALAHEAENLLVLARNEEIELVGDALDVTLMARDAMLAIVEDIQAFLAGDRSRVYTVDELLIQNLLAAQKGTPITRPTSPPPSAKPSPGTAAATSGAKKKSKVVKITESLKVDAERLDLLVDMIGELVIAESMILDRPELKFAKSPKLDALLRQLNKITRDLQGLGTSMRLVPITPVFKRMNRLVREVSKQLGKPVEFSTNGEETELDKSIVDSIADPLVHLLRNAIDHGLEPNAEERIAKGKPAAGKITLSAIQEGGSIKIRVQDDGRGMDRDRILDKALEKGLVQDAAGLSDKEVFEFIMQPGFSTAAAVTDVSGRGVGMDVVKRNIENLHGSIAIESILGTGSTFTIQLPLTLAIIDGMVVRVGAERYIIPTLGITRMINSEDTQIERVFGQRDMVNLPEGVFPLFDLQSILNCPPMPASENAASPPMIVLVEDQETRFGLLVDKMLGKQQVVIKPLGDWLGSIPGISGSAIMPDGSVGLIIDVHGVFQLGHGSPVAPPKNGLQHQQPENGAEDESNPETQASSLGNPSCP